MQHKPHRLARNKSSFLCPGSGLAEPRLASATRGHRPSREALLAEAAPSWEGRGGPGMPSGAGARVPAPPAGERLPGLLETS